MNNIYKRLGVHIPEILLPVDGTDLTKWAVIACDQYTSQPDYWQRVKDEVGQSPSTLKLIFPEIYLKDDDKDSRINNINKTMEQYLSQGILAAQKPGFILVERSTPHTPSRKGLILSVDLECYDYTVGSQSLIRATEGTVLDRLPPRVKIRENAPIELPHIMVLIDDPEKTVIEGLYASKDSCEKLYDFDLMQGGGHIRGWKIDEEESLSMVASALGKLIESGEGSCDPDVCRNGSHEGDGSASDAKRGIDGDGSPKPLLFAVGDGNHSLASAKAHWENVKAELNRQQSTPAKAANHQAATACADADAAEVNADAAEAAYTPEHPARYALVEIVNVHDDGLVFEPIHRVVFGIDSTSIQEQLINSARRIQLDAEIELFDSKEAVVALTTDGAAAIEDAEDAAIEPTTATVASSVKEKDSEGIAPAGAISAVNERRVPHNKAVPHCVPFILEGTYGLLTVHNPVSSLEVGTLQSILDEFAKNNTGENACENTGENAGDVEIDYIHGEQVVTELGSQGGCIGFYLPAMSKHDLFRTVKTDGVLPRKTFSMGEAEEKRYYLECRRIR